jgi:hypothetical protein
VPVQAHIEKFFLVLEQKKLRFENVEIRKREHEKTYIYVEKVPKKACRTGCLEKWQTENKTENQEKN